MMSRKTGIEAVTALMNDIHGTIETLNAILTLEYHDMNHLALGANPKRLNENQRELCGDAMRWCVTAKDAISNLPKK